VLGAASDLGSLLLMSGPGSAVATSARAFARVAGLVMERATCSALAAISAASC